MGWRNDDDEVARSNARRIEGGLDSLRQMLRLSDYKRFWPEVREVSECFKTLKPLTQDDRSRLRSGLDALCAEAKANMTRSAEARHNVSQRKRELVLRKLDDAHQQAKSATSSDALKAADATRRQALDWMKPGWSQVSLGDSTFTANDGRMIPQDHDACWERSKEVKETIDWKWKELKAGWERQQVQWRASQLAYRSQVVHRIDKAREMIRSLEGQIDNCRDMQRSARTSEHSYRVQGWIDEKQSKIRDIESSIARDEAKLAEIDRKLR